MNQNRIRLAIGVSVLALIAVTAFAQTFSTSEGFRVTDTFSDVRKKLVQSGATIDSLSTGTSVAFPITVAKGGTGATNGSAAQINLGIASGSLTTATDGTVTNTFSPIYSSAPIVVIAQTGSACTVTNVITITKSNFVYNAGAPSIVAKWVAVGAP